ncbi:unnamed protein product [Acanthoscelides obtectus]|uniref:Uncharacterized protein n=1 Tax=Acanthoscelides obtectus TaxID=200917 RepID=A0A9P0P6B6_ACAOB|nr:unnamed protein product [Acanthoscelides obtectus]CAK1683119.1 hypothetical protein AOBTE_LOCUS34090 [Acanthoscelides obtectus]
MISKIVSSKQLIEMIRRLINTFSSRACVSSLGFQHSTNSNRAFRMKLFYLLLLLAIFIVTITCAHAMVLDKTDLDRNNDRTY